MMVRPLEDIEEVLPQLDPETQSRLRRAYLNLPEISQMAETAPADYLKLKRRVMGQPQPFLEQLGDQFVAPLTIGGRSSAGYGSGLLNTLDQIGGALLTPYTMRAAAPAFDSRLAQSLSSGIGRSGSALYNFLFREPLQNAARRAGGAAEQFSRITDVPRATPVVKRGLPVQEAIRSSIPLAGETPVRPMDISEVFDLGNALGFPRHRVTKILQDFGVEGAHEQLRRMAPQGIASVRLQTPPSVGVPVGESIGPSLEGASIQPTVAPYSTDYMVSLRDLLDQYRSSLKGPDASKLKNMVSQLLHGRTKEDLVMVKGNLDPEKLRLFDQLEQDRRTLRHIKIRGGEQLPTVLPSKPRVPLSYDEVQGMLKNIQ